MVKVDIIQEVLSHIQSDDVNTVDESARLEYFYNKSTPAERKAIDVAFTYLCGWQLSTILKGEAN